MRDKVLALLSFVFVMLVSFTGVAFAAGAATGDDGSLLDLARPIFDAVRSGQYVLAAAGALVLVVALARKYGAKRFPFLASDAGGALLTLVGSFGGAVATALTAGAAVSAGLAWTALNVAVAAAGGYTLLKKLVVDPLLASKWFAEKCPAWLRGVINAIASLVFGKDPTAAATKAGNDAVKANPPKGTDDLIAPGEDF